MLSSLLERWLVVLVVRAASWRGRSGRVCHRWVSCGMCGWNIPGGGAMSGDCVIGRGHRRREIGIGRDRWVTLLDVTLLRGGTSPDRGASSIQNSPWYR